MNNSEKDQQEIIIVRRSHRHGEEAFHGGSWKIAYADFVTAMMAFFLVMWLINVTSDETKITIASYFNPIKFSQIGDNPLSNNASIERPDVPSKNQQKRVEGPMRSQKQRSSQNGIDSSEAQVTEEQLMLNPYEALNEIATGKKDEIKGGDDSSNKLNSQKGAAFRDFIIPEYSIINSDKAQENLGKIQQTEKMLSDESLEDSLKALSGRSVITDNQTHREAPAPGQKINSLLTDSVFEHSEQSKDKGEPEDFLAKKAAPSPMPMNDQKLARYLQQGLAAYMPAKSKFAKRAAQKDPNIDVSINDEGVLLSLMDHDGFSMFAIGSSKPSRALLNVISQTAKLLEKIDGQIVIRGHTDARPYRNKHYDNWQLSTARAQMVYYMLRRAGVSDKRINRIEGYADHKLRNNKNPNAAENRRIEILLIPAAAKQAKGAVKADNKAASG